MAMEFELDVTVNAPPEKVFALATDVERYGEWMPNFVRVERLTEGASGVGSRWREVRKMFGREAAEVFEVTRHDPPHRLDVYVDGTKGSSKRGEFRFVHRFDALEGGDATRMTLSGTIEGMGCMGAALGFFLKGMFRKAVRKDLDALKAWIEGPD